MAVGVELVVNIMVLMVGNGLGLLGHGVVGLGLWG